MLSLVPFSAHLPVYGVVTNKACKLSDCSILEPRDMLTELCFGPFQCAFAYWGPCNFLGVFIE